MTPRPGRPWSRSDDAARAGERAARAARAAGADAAACHRAYVAAYARSMGRHPHTPPPVPAPMTRGDLYRMTGRLAVWVAAGVWVVLAVSS